MITLIQAWRRIDELWTRVRDLLKRVRILERATTTVDDNDVTITYNPTYYSVDGNTLYDHLVAIDAALGTLQNSVADQGSLLTQLDGNLQRIVFHLEVLTEVEFEPNPMDLRLPEVLSHLNIITEAEA